MHVSIVTANSAKNLGERLTAEVESRWHADFTVPRIYMLAAADRAPVAAAARRIGRISARHGVFAPIIDLAVGPATLDETCTHRIGVTDLVLEPALPASELLYALGLWTRLASRKQRLLMRFSPDIDLDIVINAERANPVLCVQVGAWQAVRFAVVSPDAVAGEVVGRALRAVAIDADWDGVSPWQHPMVQHAIERRLGVRMPEDLAIRVIPEIAEQSGEASLGALIQRAARLIDVSLETAAENRRESAVRTY
jgi:hypothetical protein